MPVLLTQYVQTSYQASDEYREVVDIGVQLLRHLNEPRIQSLLIEANIPGSSSALVQAAFATFAETLGFVNEARGLFGLYANSALRPDYFRRLGDTGILMEVERGKTTTNNMDILDFWKCHLCEHANYLFLLVPRELQHNHAMRPRNEYDAVTKRMSAFFLPQNYTNVRGLHLFGY
jgi:hypothetical protein